VTRLQQRVAAAVPFGRFEARGLARREMQNRSSSVLAAYGLVLRACRDSNPKPSDP
jgi:hypothetical protein